METHKNNQRIFIINFLLFVIFFFILLSFNSYSKVKLTLQECYYLAERSSHLLFNIENREKITELKIDNLKSEYFPQLSFIGKLQYQSEVTKIGIDIPIPNFDIKMPEMPKDQYQLAINAQQLLWDGGMVSALSNLELAIKDVDIKQTEIELYRLKEMVNNTYFSILILNEKIKILNILEQTLSEKLKTVTSAVNAGILLQSNADIIKAEILSVKQSMIETMSAKRTSLEMLSKLIEIDIDENTLFEIPVITINSKISTKNRLEYSSFNLQREAINKSKDISEAKYMPKIFAFAQGLYAKPGLNMFAEAFQPGFVIGIQFSWNFWNWGKLSRENEIIEVQQNILIANEDNFSKQLNIAEKTYINNIEKLQEMIKHDLQIIELRSKIAEESSKQLDAGAITSTDYITELNKQKQSELLLAVRQIELQKLKVDYATFAGISE